MRKYHILIIGLSILASACYAPKNLTPGGESRAYHVDDTNGLYSFDLPEPLGKHLVRSDGSQIFTNNNHDLPDRQSNDYSIHVFYPMLNSNCMKSGISLQRQLINANHEVVIWGRMDYYENLTLTGEKFYSEKEAPYCKTYLSGPTYAFCANRDGKEIVMCIYQVTDNPDLAKQIFESFRWTDGNGSPEL